MKPLSAWKFVKGSFLKTLPVMVTVCLGITVLYFLSMFMQQISRQVQDTQLAPLRHVSSMSSGKHGIDPADTALIASRLDPSRYFYAQLGNVTFYNAVGHTGTNIALTDREHITGLLEAMSLKLAEGRLPERPGEVAVHKVLAANHGLPVGSFIPKGTKDWSVGRDITIVGLLSGQAIFSLGVEDSKLLTPGADDSYVSLIIVPEDQQSAEMNTFLEEQFGDKYDVSTYPLVKRSLRTIKESMEGLKIFVSIILAVVISVFLANIVGIQYTMRKKELELLHAIGYTRHYMIRKALVEVGIAGLLGYLAGILLAITLCWVINVYAWNDQGTPLPLVSPGALLTILLVPLAVTLFSMGAPLRLTRFRDIA